MKTLLRLAAILLIASSLHAAPPDHWVGTWATADVDRANTKADFAATDTVLHQTVHLSIGGPTLRVEFSNRFGTEPLLISKASVARTAGGQMTFPLQFGGHPSISIPPGATAVSDTVPLAVPALDNLDIDITLPAQKLTHLTVHSSAYQTNTITTQADKSTDPAAESKTTKTTSWFFLKSVDVLAPANSAAIVAFGDSITDGTASTNDQNKRWPDFLSRRLQADKKTANLGVLNLGIGGNRILHDVSGPSALSRFDSDVLSQDGVKYLILLESINDIGHAYDPKKPYDVVTADDLIQGITQLIDRAHAHNIKVFGATLTPYLGATYSSPEGEVVRQAVNTFIRTSKLFDGVIDFDKATIDPATGAFQPIFNTPPHEDHLHPNDAGMEAMANAINLSLFTEK